MCGILGFTSRDIRDPKLWLKNGVDLLNHRGPDSEGIWLNENQNIGLGFKRLSIIDLSVNGNQPMLSEDCMHHIVFNGEIYNHHEIRNILQNKKYVFKSSSDTEVLLYSYIEWGEKCLEKIDGMFAFAILDLVNQKFFLARDRVGEKPLFYSINKGNLYFASEIKPLLNINNDKNQISNESLNSYLENGYVQKNKSIYKDIFKLEASTYMTFNLENRKDSITQYENFIQPSKKRHIRKYFNSEEKLIEKLEMLLTNSITNKLIADVPIAFLLSGGVDSSVLVSLASRIETKINTFTVTFPGYSKFDESHHANIIAKKFNTNHYEVDGGKISPWIMDEIVQFFDEPLADSSILPTFTLFKEISNHYKVAIGGDGGDELFGGYDHYNRAAQLELAGKLMPLLLRKGIAKFILSRKNIGSKGYKSIEIFGSNFKELDTNFNHFFNYEEREKLLLNNLHCSVPYEVKEFNLSNKNLIERLSYRDFNNFLSEDILVKVDRSSMAHSVELRSPFLDKKIIDFAFNQTPANQKISLFQRKILLKKLASKILPGQFDLKRKQGFSIPINDLLKEEVWFDYFYTKISDFQTSIFDKDLLFKLMNDQKAGMQNGERLFSIVHFICWHNRYFNT